MRYIAPNGSAPPPDPPPTGRGRPGYMIPSLIVVVVGLVFSGAAGQVQRTGSVSGKVIAPADDILEGLRRGKKMLRYDDVSHATEPIEAYRLSEVAVVYVEHVPGEGSVPPPETNPTLNQSQMVFRPLVLPVTVGTTVDFPNNDNLFHNVFSYSQPKEFDLGRYPQGRKRSVTFERPGIVNVYCDIHSYMFATILVLSNPYFSLPGDDGSYSITDIPEGTYDLTFWYGRKKVATRRVRIDAGKTATADFP